MVNDSNGSEEISESEIIIKEKKNRENEVYKKVRKESYIQHKNMYKSQTEILLNFLRDDFRKMSNREIKKKYSNEYE
ncbi:hypothetical protein NUSPORA_00591 [Nucleospora cyclopteri]